MLGVYDVLVLQGRHFACEERGRVTEPVAELGEVCALF